MNSFWQFMSNVGIYIAVIFLVLTIVFAQSSRHIFQKLQFYSLITAVLLGIFSLYAISTSEGTGPGEKKSSATASSSAGRSAAGTPSASRSGTASSQAAPHSPADVQPSFVDAALQHFLMVPVFEKERPVAVLAMYFSRSVLMKKKISECFLVCQAEPSLSSDRVLLTPKKLVCRKGDGRLVALPVNGYVLDAEDGKLGLKARLEDPQAVPPLSAALVEVAKTAELVLEQRLTKGTGLEASFQVVRTGRLASVIVMEPVTLPE